MVLILKRMGGPFFRNRHWNNFQPRPVYSPSVRQVPVQRQAKPNPKVVSIPVHFVGSEQSRSDSALKIQKVFRGFLVRKSVKKIVTIKSEVDEIEKRIATPEMVELVRSESKERLRLTETLMNLLLRLDSIRGVDSGVRDRRKAVIKKAIALQERVDSIVAGDQTYEAPENNDNADSGSGAAANQVTETGDPPEVDCRASSPADCSNSSEIDLGHAQDRNLELPNVEIGPETAAALKATDLNATERADAAAHEEVELIEAEMVTDSKAIEEKETISDGTEKSDAESHCGSSPSPKNLVECGEDDENTLVKENNDEVEIVQAVKNEEEEEDCDVGGGENNNSQRNNKDILEKMMEENERMKSLMSALFERNEMQTRLLNSLSQRVGQLEKAFVCDKLRRKKKKRLACGTVVDWPHQDSNKKCGNR